MEGGDDGRAGDGREDVPGEGKLVFSGEEGEGDRTNRYSSGKTRDMATAVCLRGFVVEF